MRLRVGFCPIAAILLGSFQVAASEGQWRLGAGAGVVVPPDLSLPLGPEAAAWLSFGLLESFDLTLHTSLTTYREDSARKTLLVAEPSVLYKLDILRWVPYVGVGAGWAQHWERGSSGAFVFDGIVGVDYLLSRRWSARSEYRASFIADAADVPLSHLLFGVGFHWGY